MKALIYPAVCLVGSVIAVWGTVSKAASDQPAERPAYDVPGDDEVTGIDIDYEDTNVYFDDFHDEETGVTLRCLVVTKDFGTSTHIDLIDVDGCWRQERP